MATDISRSFQGRKATERLFLKLVEADWFAFASNPMFQREGEFHMCRLPDLDGASLQEIAKRVPNYFSVKFSQLRSADQFGRKVFLDLKEAINEIEGAADAGKPASRTKFKNILKGVSEATERALLA